MERKERKKRERDGMQSEQEMWQKCQHPRLACPPQSRSIIKRIAVLDYIAKEGMDESIRFGLSQK